MKLFSWKRGHEADEKAAAPADAAAAPSTAPAAPKPKVALRGSGGVARSKLSVPNKAASTPAAPVAPAEGQNQEDLLKALASISAALAEAESAPPPPPRAAPKPAAPVQEKPRVAGKIHDETSRDRALYQELLSGLYDAVVIVDPKGIVIGSNPRTEKLFGHTPDDLWNMPCGQLIPAMAPTVLTKIRSHVESGRFTMVNAACTRKDGTTFPAEIAINRLNLFNEGDLLFSVRSIERRLMAQDRKDIEAEVMEHAGAGIVVCTEEGLIECVNPAFLRLVQVAEDKDVLRRFMGEFCSTHEAGMTLLLKQPAGTSMWVGRVLLATSRDRTAEVLATSVRTPPLKGEHVRIVLTFTPIPKMASVTRSAAPA